MVLNCVKMDLGTLDAKLPRARRLATPRIPLSCAARLAKLLRAPCQAAPRASPGCTARLT